MYIYIYYTSRYSARKHPGQKYYVRLHDGHRQWDPPREYGTREVLAALAAVLFVAAVLSRYIGTDIQSAIQSTVHGVYWMLSWGWWLVAAPFASWRSTIWYIDCAATLYVALIAAKEWWRHVVKITSRQRWAAGFAGFVARVRFIVLREDAPEKGRTKRRIEFWLCSTAFLPVVAKVAWLFPYVLQSICTPSPSPSLCRCVCRCVCRFTV